MHAVLSGGNILIEKSTRQRFTESAIVSSIGIIFILMSVYVPILQLLIFFTAVPYILITMRNGLKYGIMSACISALAVLMFSNIFYSATLFFLFFMPGIAIGHTGKGCKEPYVPISWGFISSITLTMIYIKLLSVVFGVDIVQLVMEMFEQALEFQSTLPMHAGDIDAQEILSIMGSIIPGLIIVQAMSMSFFNYYISLSILKRVERESVSMPRISEFTLPGNIALGILIIYFLTMTMKGVPWIKYDALVANITLIILFMFFLQGFAVLGHLLSKTKMNSALKNTLLFMALVLGPFSSFVSILGFLDSIIDFRRIRR